MLPLLLFPPIIFGLPLFEFETVSVEVDLGPVTVLNTDFVDVVVVSRFVGSIIGTDVVIVAGTGVAVFLISTV